MTVSVEAFDYFDMNLRTFPEALIPPHLSCALQRGLNRRLVGKTGPEGHLRREDASLGPNSRVALKRRPVTVKRVKVSYYG